MGGINRENTAVDRKKVPCLVLSRKLNSVEDSREKKAKEST